MQVYTNEFLEPIVKRSYSFNSVLTKLDLKQNGRNRCNIKRIIKSLGLSTEHFTGKYKYSKEVLEDLVIRCNSIAEILRCLKVSGHGGNHNHIKIKLLQFGIDISKFAYKENGCIKNLKRERRSPEDILKLKPDGSNRTHGHYLKRALLEIGVEYKCSECGLGPIWNGKEINLEVDHINNNVIDDRKENLRFICPNCHSQTIGYKIKGMKIRKV